MLVLRTVRICLILFIKCSSLFHQVKATLTGEETSKPSSRLSFVHNVAKDHHQVVKVELSKGDIDDLSSIMAQTVYVSNPSELKPSTSKSSGAISSSPMLSPRHHSTRKSTFSPPVAKQMSISPPASSSYSTSTSSSSLAAAAITPTISLKGKEPMTDDLLFLSSPRKSSSLLSPRHKVVHQLSDDSVFSFNDRLHNLSDSLNTERSKGKQIQRNKLYKPTRSSSPAQESKVNHEWNQAIARNKVLLKSREKPLHLDMVFGRLSSSPSLSSHEKDSGGSSRKNNRLAESKNRFRRKIVDAKQWTQVPSSTSEISGKKRKESS